MARRNRWGELPTPKPYASIGDGWVQDAVPTINWQMQKAVTTLTGYNHTFGKTVEMLFDPSDIAKAAAARGVVVEPGRTVSYEIGTHVRLGMDFDGALTMPILQERYRPQPDKVGPLHQFVRDVEAIYLQYEEVKAVLRWLNRNATAGAIRYYWPTALHLCPKAPAFADLQEVPSRFNEPVGINARLQMLRDTATLWASSLMLPESATARQRDKMWLTFNYNPVVRAEQPGTTFTTDPITFNI